jgi:hypothetical protein
MEIIHLKKEKPNDPAMPKESNLANNRDICTLVFIIAVFTVAKLWNQPMCP